MGWRSGEQERALFHYKQARGLIVRLKNKRISNEKRTSKGASR
jgi:hypothetical protein